MKILPRATESDESKLLVERLATATTLSSYAPLEQMLALPVHVHTSTEMPNLDAVAVHLFPEGSAVQAHRLATMKLDQINS